MSSSQAVARGHQAFSLLEYAVVASVIGTVALVLAPTIFAFMTQSRVARARSDCHTIGTAIIRYYIDTGLVPGDRPARDRGDASPRLPIQILASQGRMPPELLVTTWSTGRTANLINALVMVPAAATIATLPQGRRWLGPYLQWDPGPDPWGQRYVVNVGLLEQSTSQPTDTSSSRSVVWVLSAGPNGLIDTPYFEPNSAAELRGDDVGIRIQ